MAKLIRFKENREARASQSFSWEPVVPAPLLFTHLIPKNFEKEKLRKIKEKSLFFERIGFHEGFCLLF